jgi:hypothetical protein
LLETSLEVTPVVRFVVLPRTIFLCDRGIAILFLGGSFKNVDFDRITGLGLLALAVFGLLVLAGLMLLLLDDLNSPLLKNEDELRTLSSSFTIYN